MSTNIDPKMHLLDSFRGEMRKWRDTDHEEERQSHRSYLARHRRAVRQRMVDAGAHQLLWVREPGPDGPENVQVDPLNVIFTPPPDVDIFMAISDMIDETMGALTETDWSSEGAGPGSYFGSAYFGRAAPELATPTLVVVRGRVELTDPPLSSPLKLNRLRDDLPEQLAAVTTALTGLITAVNDDNSALSETVRAQLIAMLEIALVDLKAPYTDVGRLERTRTFIKTVGTAAATGAATATLTTQFENAATALGNAVDWLIKLAS
jgi:hypothetical protein